MRKLKAVLLDDDPFVHHAMKDLCSDSPHIELVKSFETPKELLAAFPSLDCDLFFIDIVLPEMNGFQVVKYLNGKPFIFITSMQQYLPEALSLTPVYVLYKPIQPEVFRKIAEKAYNNVQRNERKHFLLFTIENTKGRTALHLEDILFVSTIDKDSRDKKFYMRDGKEYIIKRCNLDKLLKNSPKLVRINKGELISGAIIERVENDIVYLKEAEQRGYPSQVHVGRVYLNQLFKTLCIA